MSHYDFWSEISIRPLSLIARLKDYDEIESVDDFNLVSLDVLNELEYSEHLVKREIELACNHIKSAVEIVRNADPDQLTIHLERRDGREDGWCDVRDVVTLLIPLAVNPYKGSNMSKLIGFHSLWDRKRIRISCDADLLTSVVGKMVNSIMCSASCAPAWWNKLREISKTFHDAPKRYAMSIVGASFWILNYRKWQNYNTPEYDYIDTL